MFSFTKEQFVAIGEALSDNVIRTIQQDATVLYLIHHLAEKSIITSSDSDISIVYKTIVQCGNLKARSLYSLTTPKFESILLYGQAEDYLITLIGKLIYRAVHKEFLFLDRQIDTLIQTGCLIPDMREFYRTYYKEKGESDYSIERDINMKFDLRFQIYYHKFLNPDFPVVVSPDFRDSCVSESEV